MAPIEGDRMGEGGHGPGRRTDVPWVDSPTFEAELESRSGELTGRQRQVAVDLHHQGFALLEGVVPDELCDRVRHQVGPLFEEEYARRERRVPDAWDREAPAVREVALLPEVQECLAIAYGRRPIPFQTLNFQWGSEQGYHSDAIHFTSAPDRFLCGVWVALEDVDDDNGPLTYYPGSHRVPQFRSFEPGSDPDRYAEFEDRQRVVMTGLGVAPVDLHARRGDALVWSAHLLHGGRPIRRPGRTRWSQVTHYYFEDCLYYQPIYSDFLTGELKLMTIRDLTTLEPVVPAYDDLQVVSTPVGGGRHRLGLVDRDGVEVAGDVARIGRLESDLAASQAACEELRGSTSFRLGQKLVGPLHRLRGGAGR